MINTFSTLVQRNETQRQMGLYETMEATSTGDLMGNSEVSISNHLQNMEVSNHGSRAEDADNSGSISKLELVAAMQSPSAEHGVRHLPGNIVQGLGLMSQLLGICFTSPNQISVGNYISNSWVM